MKKTIGLIYNPNKKKNIDLVQKVERFLQSKHINTWRGKAGIEKEMWKSLKGKTNLALIFGGDGTLLGSSRILAPKGIPMFGINTGHLGFLTEGTKGNVIKLVSQILKKRFTIDERSLLEVHIHHKKRRVSPLYALNDVVISRGTNRKMINITLCVDNKAASDYISDGLIISTPTGSTAYALSAGGAVMEPEVNGIEIVPLCAHTLTSRPHIVSGDKEIEIVFNKPSDGATLTLDGQETLELMANSKIIIKKSRHKAKLLRLKSKENNFYFRIREKFLWGRTIN